MKRLSLLLAACMCTLLQANADISTVTIALHAKNEAAVLPECLRCIERQTWPKHKTHIYIRTNNNTDETASILRAWVEKMQDHYLEIFFDDSDVVEQVQQYKKHEWNYERFKVLGKIRQDSVRWAHSRRSHYFVVDCDNFIKPDVITTLVQTGLPIVAPFLCRDELVSCYANYHACIDASGYYADDPVYYQIFNQHIKGLIEVPVVHCTYLIRYEVLDTVCYDDGSGRYEYVIFSDRARTLGIPQYLDNRALYGRITMAETRDEFLAERWYPELATY